MRMIAIKKRRASFVNYKRRARGALADVCELFIFENALRKYSRVQIA
jgi:hypothetical protein